MNSRHPVRALVLGLGPAGRAAAHRGAARGWQVLALDPAGGTMPSTVGAWAHQLPRWLAPSAVVSRFRPTVVTSDGTPRLLRDEYAVLDTDALAGLGGFEVRLERADPDALPPADVTVDTTPTRPATARQLAYGQIFGEDDVPVQHRVPVLMDFSVPAGAADEGLPATFSYRLPLGDGRWLIEETILATQVEPGEGEPLHGYLRRMQAHRLMGLGVDAALAHDDEVVDFPLAPLALPRASRGASRFGAAGGWMHPATGYSVGAALADVDRFLDRLAGGQPAGPPGGIAQTWLRRRGLHVLLGFDPDETRAFFDAFFRLPDPAIRTYLTGPSAAGTLAVMLRLAPALGRRSPATLAHLLARFAAPTRTLHR